MNIPTKWTSEERIAVATALLGIIQLDIPAGRYGAPGRPNVESALSVLHEPAEILNQCHDSLVAVLELAPELQR